MSAAMATLAGMITSITTILGAVVVIGRYILKIKSLEESIKDHRWALETMHGGLREIKQTLASLYAEVTTVRAKVDTHMSDHGSGTV